MNILFIHQNFPGQYQHLAAALAQRGHRVAALRLQGNGYPLPGVTVHEYTLAQGNTPGIHPYAQEFETKVLRAEACARLAEQLKAQGFIPDVVHAHPAWGESLYIKDIFPQTRLIHYAEYYYQAQGQDVDFDPEFPRQTFRDLARLRTKNANLLSALESMDQGVSPTHWQARSHPLWAQQKIQVIHDGINTRQAAPDHNAELGLPQHGLHLRAGDEVLTYVARNLEPVRGYHRLMRALPEILRRRPQVKVVLVGGDGVSYGARPATGSFRQQYWQEVAGELDARRVFFLGKLSYRDYLRVLQVSRCHVYLTYPFVLSWSLLEAMSVGALVVGSRTPPVTEVITHGDNGLLADFFDAEDLAEQVCRALENAPSLQPLRERARHTVRARYDLHQHCLPRHVALTESGRIN